MIMKYQLPLVMQCETRLRIGVGGVAIGLVLHEVRSVLGVIRIYHLENHIIVTLG